MNVNVIASSEKLTIELLISGLFRNEPDIKPSLWFIERESANALEIALNQCQNGNLVIFFSSNDELNFFDYQKNEEFLLKYHTLKSKNNFIFLNDPLMYRNLVLSACKKFLEQNGIIYN